MKMSRLNLSFLALFCYGVVAGAFMDACVRSFMGFEDYMISVQDRGEPFHWFVNVLLVLLCVGMSVKQAREHKDLDS